MRRVAFVDCRVMRAGLGAVLALLVVVPSAWAGAAWAVAAGDVKVTCPLTVGGSFQARTTALKGTVQSNTAASPSHRARLVVDLRTLDTGIDLRTEHMRANYLEVDKAQGYDQAVISDVDLTGLKADAPEGKARFTAMLALHGVSRPVSGQAEVRRDGTGLKVKASFPVQLSSHMIPEPRYLGVGVKDQVIVEVTFTATPDAAANATR